MNDSYRHFYLYAKGWYLRTDLIEDLKKIAATRCMLPIESMREKDVILVLTNAVKPYVVFDRFINSLMDNQWLDPKGSINTHLCMSMLSVLSGLKVSEIPFDIGEPDTDILPLNIVEQL